MTELDEAVERLEEGVEYIESHGGPGEHWKDIRIVLDMLAIHQRGIVDLTQLSGRFQRERDEALAVIERAKAKSQEGDNRMTDVQVILNTAPVDALQERDAEKWDEAIAAVHARVGDDGMLDQHRLIRLVNPYRKGHSAPE